MSDSNHKSNEWWSEAKRIEVVTTWLALGKIPLVSACTKVPEGTIRQWRTQPWWRELELSIQTETDQELDAKLAKRIDKALDVIWDRLEHGDFLYDPKTGDFIRKPVGMKDVNKVMVDMMDKRLLIRKQPKDLQSQEAVADILKNLAKEFAGMVKAKVKDGTITSEAKLPAGVSELPGDSGTDQEPKPT
jgi:hypothetical protein